MIGWIILLVFVLPALAIVLEALAETDWAPIDWRGLGQVIVIVPAVVLAGVAAGLLLMLPFFWYIS